jgi:hypothetical protein
VLKNGANTLSRIAAGMPGPSSSISTRSAAGRARGRHADPAAARARVHGVRDQVVDRLPDLVGVREHEPAGRGEIGNEAIPRDSTLGREHREAPRQLGIQVDGATVDGRQPAEAQVFLHDIADALDLRRDRPDERFIVLAGGGGARAAARRR